jgi:hypothetical protein
VVEIYIEDPVSVNTEDIEEVLSFKLMPGQAALLTVIRFVVVYQVHAGTITKVG